MNDYNVIPMHADSNASMPSMHAIALRFLAQAITMRFLAHNITMPTMHACYPCMDRTTAGVMRNVIPCNVMTCLYTPGEATLRQSFFCWCAQNSADVMRNVIPSNDMT